MADYALLNPKGVYISEDKAFAHGLCLLIEGTEISRVGRRETLRKLRGTKQLKAESSWTEIDLSDRYVMPGLINTHVHLTFSAGTDPLKDYMADSALVKGARAVIHAQELLRSGVTTVRDAGSENFLLTLNQVRELGITDLPRLVLCGAPLTITGGHLHFMHGEADGPDGVRKAVRERRKMGAASIKLIASGGQFTPNTMPEQVSYSVEELTAAVQEARSLGLPTTAHCLPPESIRRAVRAGIGCVDHCVFFTRNDRGWLEHRYDEDIARELRDSNIPFAMGLSLGARLDVIREKRERTPGEDFLLERDVVQTELFARLVGMGVPPVVGTDSGVANMPFDRSWLEAVFMVRAGMRPAAAIEAFTETSARVLGLEKAVGRIQSGFSADLIALPRDPLSDITALGEVDWVMHRGKVVRDDRRAAPVPAD